MNSSRRSSSVLYEVVNVISLHVKVAGKGEASKKGRSGHCVTVAVALATRIANGWLVSLKCGGMSKMELGIN